MHKLVKPLSTESVNELSYLGKINSRNIQKFTC